MAGNTKISTLEEIEGSISSEDTRSKEASEIIACRLLNRYMKERDNEVSLNVNC